MQRQRHSAEQWAAWFDEFEAGDLTVAEFCRRKGVSSNSFYQWRKKLPDSATDQTFVAVNIAEVDSVQIDLPGGATLRVPNHPAALRPVLEVLAAIDGQQ